MTVKELYDWAVENNVLNAELMVDNYYGKTHSVMKESLCKNKDDNVFIEIYDKG